MIEDLSPMSLLMPSPPAWLALARSVYGEKLSTMPRYSFRSDGLSLSHLQGILQRSQLDADIVPLDAGLATEVWAGHPFVDLSMFDSGQDFAERGLGFCMIDKGEIIAAAYSSLVCSKGIEVSVFVMDEYRKRGLATALGSKLLSTCLAQGIAAHWDAANETSVHIAQRLGYGQAEEYEAYWVRQ
jgi:GNAT superfamily N-acetyltransferase